MDDDIYQMGQDEFASKLKELYPEIYDLIFRRNGSYYIMSSYVVDFMSEHKITSYSYGEVYMYIIENEAKHTWWML